MLVRTDSEAPGRRLLDTSLVRGYPSTKTRMRLGTKGSNRGYPLEGVAVFADGIRRPTELENMLLVLPYASSSP